jgi:hypothetical protein
MITLSFKSNQSIISSPSIADESLENLSVLSSRRTLFLSRVLKPLASTYYLWLSKCKLVSAAEVVVGLLSALAHNQTCLLSRREIIKHTTTLPGGHKLSAPSFMALTSTYSLITDQLKECFQG